MIKQIRPLTTIPLLRKDFIFDPYQIYETVLLGGDAFLIIAMLVSEAELKQMLLIAQKLNLEVLVEVHTREELDQALAAGSQIVGINNRNLKTLEINHSVSENLIRFIPKGTVAVIESGIESREEIIRYQAMGGNCFLIGTALMKAANVKQTILELYGQSKGVQ
ncbi:MAG: indole-3-glycerol-phosphate synthase [Candidatus Omnitrophica bacterium]|nr:indole-3-glycerol-phosphate synthase [Candidatus Omnitrophota bacterium]